MHANYSIPRHLKRRRRSAYVLTSTGTQVRHLAADASSLPGGVPISPILPVFSRLAPSTGLHVPRVWACAGRGAHVEWRVLVGETGVRRRPVDLMGLCAADVVRCRMVDRASGGAVIDAIRRLITLVLPYRPMRGGKRLLDSEYARGEWDYLRGPSELARFSIVAGYCLHYKPHGSILEIGCGEGLLPERLGPQSYSRYLGVDISDEAIAKARPRQNERTAFMAEDAMRLHLQDRFDVIIFNECLEYFDEPLALLHRYEAFLHGAGIYIVSIFDGIDTARSWKIWRMLRRRYTAEAVIHVRNEVRYAWTIEVLRPQHQMSGPCEQTAFSPPVRAFAADSGLIVSDRVTVSHTGRS